MNVLKIQQRAVSRAPRSPRAHGRIKDTRGARTTLRPATRAEAPELYRLITANLEAGRLLPRRLEELAVHAPRFFVATDGDGMIGCAELAPLSHAVAEVRSLVVDERYRGAGLGSRLVLELKRRARLDGYGTLCAFTHDPAYFVRLGFSIVPHVWLPEKIATDCFTCPRFRSCGQYAMIFPLDKPLAIEPRLGPAAECATPGGHLPVHA